MTLATLIRKRDTQTPANDNPAKVAKDGKDSGDPLAGLAALALANLSESANGSRADERIAKMTAKLKTDPGLRYAMEAHDKLEPDSVILTLAIRGKAACEFRIPRERYDPFLLLDLIERHGGTIH